MSAVLPPVTLDSSVSLVKNVKMTEVTILTEMTGWILGRGTPLKPPGPDSLSCGLRRTG
jgi:hypothetical protein